MIIKRWKKIHFVYTTMCTVDENELRKAIKWYSDKPRASRHGNTTNICEDIKSRILIALEKAKGEK